MDTFDVIADPTRRAILDLLRAGPMTAGAIAEAFPSSRPGISRHLRHLREAGVVVMHEEGRSRVYRIRPGWQQPVVGWLRQFEPPISESVLDAFETEAIRTRRDFRAASGKPSEIVGESA